MSRVPSSMQSYLNTLIWHVKTKQKCPLFTITVLDSAEWTLCEQIKSLFVYLFIYCMGREPLGILTSGGRLHKNVIRVNETQWNIYFLFFSRFIGKISLSFAKQCTVDSTKAQSMHSLNSIWCIHSQSMYAHYDNMHYQCLGKLSLWVITHIHIFIIF